MYPDGKCTRFSILTGNFCNLYTLHILTMTPFLSKVYAWMSVVMGVGYSQEVTNTSLTQS